MKPEDFQKMDQKDLDALAQRTEEHKKWLSQCTQKSANGVKGTIHFCPEKGHWFRIYHEDKSYTDYDLNHYDLTVRIEDNYTSLFENVVTGNNTLSYPEIKPKKRLSQ